MIDKRSLMKKLFLMFLLVLAGGCVRAGDYNILASRNDIFTMWNGYRISFYDAEPVLTRTEEVEENNYEYNVAQTVKKGYSVLNNKFYQKEFFVEKYLKANKNGVLNSASLPVKIKADKKYTPIGTVKIEGQKYRLLPSELEDFAMLIDEQGVFYNRIGQIKGSYLILLDTEFFPYPADLKIQEISKTTSTQSAAVKGFDVKYDGVKLDRIWFTYFDYTQNEAGTFSNLSFPNKPGLITIHNVGFRVLSADEDKITYMVLTE